MIIIVEFKYMQLVQVEDATKQFKTEAEVVIWAADMSVKHIEFEIVRINKYNKGKLVPYELSLKNGRIDLVSKHAEMDDAEARMRLSSSRRAGNSLFE